MKNCNATICNIIMIKASWVLIVDPITTETTIFYVRQVLWSELDTWIRVMVKFTQVINVTPWLFVKVRYY